MNKNTKNAKNALVFICILSTIIISLAGCSHSDQLSGKYISESGQYSIEFKSDGTCRWYQKILDSESFFDGTYEKSGNTYRLFIKGDGFLTFNTTFTAEPADNGLIITGGIVQGELFSKQ